MNRAGCPLQSCMICLVSNSAPSGDVHLILGLSVTTFFCIGCAKMCPCQHIAFSMSNALLVVLAIGHASHLNLQAMLRTVEEAHMQRSFCVQLMTGVAMHAANQEHSRYKSTRFVRQTIMLFLGQICHIFDRSENAGRHIKRCPRKTIRAALGGLSHDSATG